MNRFKWGCVVAIIAGIIIKILFLDYQYGDYRSFLSPWVDYIKTYGYFDALKDDFHNYTPTYIYALVAIAKLDV